MPLLCLWCIFKAPTHWWLRGASCLVYCAGEAALFQVLFHPENVVPGSSDKNVVFMTFDHGKE